MAKLAEIISEIDTDIFELISEYIFDYENLELDILKYFLENKNVDINQTNSIGSTPFLYYVLKGGDDEVIFQLFKDYVAVLKAKDARV